jgi:hypothetical protein
MKYDCFKDKLKQKAITFSLKSSLPSTDSGWTRTREREGSLLLKREGRRAEKRHSSKNGSNLDRFIIIMIYCHEHSQQKGTFQRKDDERDDDESSEK